MSRLRVLIVGGYGTFGGRLVQLLSDEPRLTLIVSGRSLASAVALCRRIASRAELLPACFDRDADIEAQLAAHAADIVVDASGPFQTYGTRPYRLPEACIAAGIDYLDLADSAEFVRGVEALDARAKARGVFVLSAASSFPVLTAAVVRRLSDGLVRIESVRGGIAPSPYAGVGLNVVRAIAGYAGSAVTVWRERRFTTAYGFLEQRRVTIAPPGRLPLHSRLFSLVDVPDLRVLPELWPTLGSVWMGAGPVPVILHRALIWLAWIRRLKLIPALASFAGALHLATRVLRWGEHRGGMFVAVEGVAADGSAVGKSWHLIAEGDDGPFIPSMAAEALIRKLLEGERPAPGARSAARDLELADYERLFARRAIFTGVRSANDADAPLYRRLLGSAWRALPEEIRRMHDVGHGHSATGVASVTRGEGLIAGCVAALLGLPRTAGQVPVRVKFEVAKGSERWTRTFGDRSFASEHRAAHGRDEGLVCERFGPFSLLLAAVLEQDRLRFVVRGWRFLSLRLPRWLGPVCDSYECVEGGRFRFDVAVSHPLAGPIVRYRGWLQVDRH